VTRVWPAEGDRLATVSALRDDLVLEKPADGPTGDELPGDHVGSPHSVDQTRGDEHRTLVFHQDHGPFSTYERVVTISETEIIERTSYHATIPWFGWIFWLPLKLVIARRISHRGWWAPPDRLDATQVLVIGLLAAASMSAAFINTLFTQTVNFAADDFGVSDSGIGYAGAIVRAGIIVALPAAVIADRIGRRRVITLVAWLAPLLSLLGAAAPNFTVLVATQTVARPMGIALAFLIGVVAAEEMPKNSRAYAISVIAMAAGFGAGLAVMSLGLADLGEGGWRLVYLVSVIWCAVALDLVRRLPETRRFTAGAGTNRTMGKAPRLDRRRLALLGAVAFIGNIFIAPASFFQNNYLTDIRNFSGLTIGVFSIAVGTPAGLALLLGGRIADTRGRRPLIMIALPAATAAVVLAFTFGGPMLWVFAFLASTLGSMVYPAMAVYRAELFPTGNRSRAAGIITALALVGGIGGLILTGRLIDAGWSYSRVMVMLAVAQLVVTIIVLTSYPETAHRELEDMNPEDMPLTIP
jgi:MFS family permease